MITLHSFTVSYYFLLMTKISEAYWMIGAREVITCMLNRNIVGRISARDFV